MTEHPQSCPNGCKTLMTRITSRHVSGEIYSIYDRCSECSHRRDIVKGTTAPERERDHA